ncbi:MAG TPA: hypothetical protein EYG67_04510 [Campylobacterales bacterium]|nr:hypothetical protein [Campylobacterales bacterium]HIP41422.1 hypothetical protein [Campylobacterales bacterium]
MNLTIKQLTIISGIFIFTGCVPVTYTPKPTIQTPTLGSPVQMSKYGYPPQNYQLTIKNYFSNKLKHASTAQYTFSSPQRAYKKKGFAYGGGVEWEGWMVDVSIATQNRTGRMLSPKPYMVLFKNSMIIEDILGNNHKLITKVTP